MEKQNFTHCLHKVCFKAILNYSSVRRKAAQKYSDGNLQRKGEGKKSQIVGLKKVLKVTTGEIRKQTNNNKKKTFTNCKNR